MEEVFQVEGLASAKICRNSEEQRRHKGEWEQMRGENKLGDHTMLAC